MAADLLACRVAEPGRGHTGKPANKDAVDFSTEPGGGRRRRAVVGGGRRPSLRPAGLFPVASVLLRYREGCEGLCLVPWGRRDAYN